MKTLRTLSLFLVALGVSLAQTPLVQTTLSGAVTPGQTNIVLASVTGVVANTTLLFVDKEAISVISVSGTTVHVQRGASGTRASGHVTGSGVLVGPANAFVAVDPQGSCTAGAGVFLYTPVVNVTNGLEWLCSINGKVTPGWGNSVVPPNSTTAVASAVGLVTPSGPLFHVTGTSGITGFNIPVGFDPKAGGGFCIVPDGVLTTTAANNIALATAFAVSKTICYTYEPNAAKPFFPSY
jgi:hypothetical protein